MSSIHDTADARREEELWRAFLAGFEASAEGFNGEWTNARYTIPDVLRERLYPEFRREVLGLDPDVPA